MHILITGGFGFIGGRLAQHLEQAGHQIVLGTRNAVSAPDWLPNVRVVETNWSDSKALEQICTGVDVIIHAAGMNAQDCALNPVEALEFNGLATSRLIEAACKVGVQRFFYLSTAHVYASPLVGIITEETCPRNLHPYATSHMAGENVVLNAFQRGGTTGIVLRLSNAFGAPMHKDVNCWMLVMNDLCRQAVQTGKIVLLTNGQQYRNFITISEVCRIIEELLSYEFDAGSQNIINVGSTISKTVLEMAQLIQQRCACILNVMPSIEIPDKGGDEQYQMLEYRADRLAEMSINIESNFKDEIENILRFCITAFNE